MVDKAETVNALIFNLIEWNTFEVLIYFQIPVQNLAGYDKLSHSLNSCEEVTITDRQSGWFQLTR